MTVSSTTNRNSYTGNDTTAQYAYSFKIFREEDISVFVRNVSEDRDIQLKCFYDNKFLYVVIRDEGIGFNSDFVIKNFKASQNVDNIFTINSYMSTVLSTVFYSGLLFTRERVK